MSALIIANTQIRRDQAGRYCLNDLHQASGSEKRHQPANWIRLDQAQDLIAEIENQRKSAGGLLTSEEAPLFTANDGFANGTYTVKELVYAYAMWISAKFHLHVIQAYDALVSEVQVAALPQPAAAPMHRADQMVSAQRIFAAGLRTARAMRLTGARAIRAANASALRATGIDWADELGVELPADDPMQLPGMPDWPGCGAVLAFVAMRDTVTMDEVLRATFPDHMESMAVRNCIGRVLAASGWRSNRKRLATGGWGTEYRRMGVF